MALTIPFLKNQSEARLDGHRGQAVLHELAPSALVHDEQVIVQHIREGRFQRSLSLITAFASLLSGLEVSYEHYIGSYSQQIMFTPVFLSAGLFLTSIWAVFNRWMARVLMPIVSLLNMLNGLIGFYLHIRGVQRKPGGWRLPVFNVVMGPPLMAPLLFMSSGFLGLIAAFLRREDDLTPPLPKKSGRSRRSFWLDMLPQEITRDVSTIEQDIREGRFQRFMGIATAISGLFSGMESVYSHYKNNFQYRIEWTPVILTPAVMIAGIGTVWSRTIARTLLPITSALALIDGTIGFFYHVRGVLRRPDLYNKPFVKLSPHDQDAVLQTIHDEKPPAAQEIWQKMSVQRFWMLLVQDVVDAYYAHPYAWDEIGYGGPAYPRGYMRLEGGQAEPWEVDEQRYEWKAPPFALSDVYRPIGGVVHDHKRQTPGQEGTH